MIIDALLQLASAQAVTATALSANVIDLLNNNDLGEGEDLFAVVTVDAAATASGAATVEFQLLASAASSMTSPVEVGTTGPISKSALVPGAMFPIRINPQIGSLGLRYLSANFVVTTGPLITGAFSVNFTRNIQDGRKNYPSGFTVA